MNIILVLIALVIAVLLCDKFEERLPRPIALLYGGWKKFAHVLGVIMSFLILTLLWIVGFGLYAVVARILSLSKWFAAEPTTYWKESEPVTPESLTRQF